MPAGLAPQALWAAVAEAVDAFAARAGVLLPDTVVLLPFAQLLAPARQAWAARAPNGWSPRFETTRTLAEALQPPAPAVPGGPSFDLAVDRLQAAQLLRDAAPDWPARDARGFELAVRRVVDSALALTEARRARPPADRAGWIAAARERLAGTGGPAAGERALARLAFEWSLAADTGAADALFAHRPAGWVALRAGGRDPLVEAVLGASDAPVLWLDADLPADMPPPQAAIAVCSDFEDEAQRAAAAVLAHVQRGETPVALVALDRVLLRRVRALLARQPLALADETGWKLSTTRAAAAVVGLLRAAAPRASADELLDALKSLPPTDDAALHAFEAALRQEGWTDASQIAVTRLPPAAQPPWAAWLRTAEPLRPPGRATLALADWLARLHASLHAAGLLAALAADAAGAQVLAALRCDADPAPGSAWAAAAGATRLTAGGLLAWVDGVLEQVTFRPPADAEAVVVITPLARAGLRPFAAVVCPGADAAHLGAGSAPEPLLGDALAVALGLPGVAAQREAERLAFAQLARVPRLTLLHRQTDGSEPLVASPLLRRWQLAAARAGRPLAVLRDPRVARSVAPHPTPRPRPVAPALLPDRYSASRYEQLRACPYRFYAASMLGLGEVEELDDELEKREVGTWLHEVLQRFHDGRPADAADDLAALLAIATETTIRHFGSGPAAADFLPFEAWFEGVAPAYVDGLHAAEALGWSAQASERALSAELRPDATSMPLRLHSRLDRIDRRVIADGDAPDGEGAGEHRRLIDYKLKSKAAVQALVRRPFEDTQLAFYAALLARAEGWPEGGLEAGYLALDGRDGPAWVAHPDVADSAQALLDGLASDVARLRAGAPLPALGEGAACDHCAARGLCRKDHWEVT